MERILLQELKKWKVKKGRLPLILKGAKQVGKTWLLREFGRTCFKDVCYINFEQTPNMNDVFSGDIRAQRIIDYLTAISGKKIDAQNTLIIFDEVQEVPRALSSLKSFAEQAPEYSICCAGSLLGIALHQNTSFPVGKTEFLTLQPFSFEEFLLANEEQNLVNFIKKQHLQNFPFSLCSKLNDYLKQYYIIGGMPSVISLWISTRDYSEVVKKKNEILFAYEQDFSKHAPKNLVPKIRFIWNSIPSQLAKENKKFIYGLIREGARAREYEDALLWLLDSGLIRSVGRITKPSLPLKSYQDLKSFKIYHLDIGLLGAMSDLSPEAIIEKIKIFEEFKGALTEQFVLQELSVVSNIQYIYYWTSEATAEIDFIFLYKSIVLPIEVKAGIHLYSKSLKLYREKYLPKLSVRVSLSNLEYNNGLLNIPLYSLFNLLNFLEKAT